MKKISISFLLPAFLFFINPAKTVAFIPNPSHVVVLVLENHGYNTIVGSPAAPYINSLINDSYCALFTNSHALSHPSQPNYLQLFSGSTQGSTSDAVPAGIPFSTPNLAAELTNASKTFIGYSESMPNVGYTGAAYGSYASKHNPWVDWQGTGLNGISPSSNQPFTAFPTNYNLLPTVSFVVPNQDNDMHNGSDPLRISTADTWVQTHLDAYIQWAKTNNSLLIITFDEDDYSFSQQIMTLFIGSNVQGGSYSDPIDHYSILSLLEDMYYLPNSGAAALSGPIDYCWTNCNSLHVTISPGATVSLCPSGPVTLTAGGALTYLWQPGNISGPSITVTPTATTTYSVTGTDAAGCVKTTSRLILVGTAAPASPGGISGSTTVCSNTANIAYSVSAVANVYYNWTPPAGVTIISGQGTNTIMCNFGTSWTSGSLTVTASNGCGTSAARTLALKSVLAAPSAITGSAYQCAATTVSFGCTAVAGATGYTWSITGDATVTSVGNTATVTFGLAFTTGVLSVVTNNLCGSSVARTLTIKNFVATPGVISGAIVGLCPSGISTTTYSVAAVAGAASYIWILPTGVTGTSSTNSISVNIGPSFTSGNISCAAVSVCGIASTPKLLFIKSVLSSPTAITGTAAGLCNLNNVSFSCSTVTGATSYTWTVPAGASVITGQGTSLVTVNFGTFASGNISVTANNACGSSPAKTLALKGTPAAPTVITGVTGVCANQQGVIYTTPAVTNTTSYTWTVPTGATIASGQTTTAIVVNFGAAAGNVTVKTNNACGSSSTKVLTTTIVCIDVVNDNEEKSLENNTESDFYFKVHSNSMENEMTLIITSDSDKEVSIILYDLLGNELMNHRHQLTTGENSITTNVEGFSKGIYFVKMEDENGNRINKKIVMP